MTDAELVQQTLAGRTHSFEELVRRWAPRITALCHAKVGCRTAADDLAQESMLRGYRALASLSEPEKFGAWLCRIATRVCLDWLKARERSQVRFSELGADHNPDNYLLSRSGESSEREEDLQRLRAEVVALPDVYRQVVMLYYHQDMTYRDLAQMLGVSTATVNARLTKARVLLRERLIDCRR